MTDVKWELVQLLNDKWNNTNAVEPEITDESYDEELNLPQLCLPRDDENAEGESGFWAMSGTDGGPIQLISGETTGGIWTTREAIQGIDTDLNPKTWLTNTKEEVARITQNNLLAITPLEYIALVGDNDLHETDRDPTIYRKVIRIGYQYLRGA